MTRLKISPINIIIGIFLMTIQLISCGKNNEGNSVVDPQLNAVISEDSAELFQLFTQMMSVDSSIKDSLYQRAQFIGDKGSRQNYFFEIFELRYWINIGRRKEAYDKISEKISSYNDSLAADLGHYYNLLGIYYSYEGKIKEAVQAYEKSIRVFDLYGSIKNAAVIRQNLVNIFYSSMDYSQAYSHALEANKVFNSLKDSYYLPINESLLAISAIGMDSLNLAEKYIQSINNWSEISTLPIVKIISNFASGEYALSVHAYSDAMRYFNKSIELSHEYKNFMMMQPTLASLIRANVSAGLYAEAISNGNRLLELSKQTGNKDIGYSVRKNMAYAYAGLQQYESAYHKMKDAERIFQETRKVDGQDALRELLVKYEAELKENQILIQQGEIDKQRGWILLLVMLALLGFTLFLWKRSVDKNRRQLLEKNKEKEILQALFDGEEKERIRLADELHNGIASNLVAIRIQLENAFNADDNEKIQSILNVINRTHEETRLMAHNLQSYDFAQYSLIETVRNFCHECSTILLPIHFSTNLSHIPIEDSKARLLYRSIQECIQNAIKHSKAEEINVQILGSENEITCSIEDNGVGFDRDAISDQSSFHQMVLKLDNIDMKLNVDTLKGFGTSIFIKFKI